ncbi:MAG TPA: type IV pilus assembly protein PilM [bacterium]|nr:type IV pilus assembly protein PilM [bacterium]
MTFSLFKIFSFSKRCLGIDIGSSCIRIVELSKRGNKAKLENYIELKPPKQKLMLKRGKESVIFPGITAKAIRMALDKAGIKTKRAVFTLPDYSTLFTWFELPSMTKEEIPEAVKYEARHHSPSPLSEVTLDWQIIEKGEKKIKVLLVIVSKETVNQYQRISNLAQLEGRILEAEVFAFTRSSVKEKDKTIALVDIGEKTSTCSIIDNGVLKRSYSFDFSGEELTEAVSKSLNIDIEEAEQLKRSYGLYPGEEKKAQGLKEALLPGIKLISKEINGAVESFYQSELKRVQKVILGGGGALLLGLKEHLIGELKMEVETAAPFSNISCPSILENTLAALGPSYAIAVGAALRGLE